MACARPVAASQEISVAAILGLPLAASYLPGMPVRKRLRAELHFDPDDGVVRAGHADVGLERGALRQDALVGGGHVGVGAEHSGDPAVEIPAERLLFAGGFGVDVDEDDLGGDLLEQLVGFAKGVVACGHEDAALQVDDGVLGAGVPAFRRERALIAAEADGRGRVVAGAQQAARALVRGGEHAHVVEDFALVPDVVAGW